MLSRWWGVRLATLRIGTTTVRRDAETASASQRSEQRAPLRLNRSTEISTRLDLGGPSALLNAEGNLISARDREVALGWKLMCTSILPGCVVRTTDRRAPPSGSSSLATRNVCKPAGRRTLWSTRGEIPGHEQRTSGYITPGKRARPKNVTTKDEGLSNVLRRYRVEPLVRGISPS